MNIGRILGLIIIALGIFVMNYFDFEDSILGFAFGLLTGLGVILLIKGELKNPLKS
ncbi:MAG: hypothetical protein R3218_03690 [Christiangramia sp.]|nr:hypothetical protein [Christiangramia sp.]